jgi:uncharacterized protein YlxW (UPF0749 family)
MAIIIPSNKRWVIPFTFVCLVLGALLGVQFHTQQLAGESQGRRQTTVLVDRLTRNEAQITEQQDEIERLRALVGEYEKQAASERGITQLMSDELHTARIALGMVEVKGPGITLEVTDSTMKASEGLGGGGDVYVIHDFDLLQIANELWRAGAEAISINGQRLITGSAISCSARLIEVNRVTVASPFIFQAIGDKEKLSAALNIRDGVLDRLRVLQFPVKLTPKDNVVIPPIPVTPKYEFAKPVEKKVAK